MGNIVSLDIDDLNGQDEYGRWIAICYLEDGKNFNNMLVESGNAARKDFRSNEFDPFSWRDIEVKSDEEDSSPGADSGLWGVLAELIKMILQLSVAP
jgi:endonuclease YncB( thermonuclease family)